jgi:hypothetical protein
LATAGGLSREKVPPPAAGVPGVPGVPGEAALVGEPLAAGVPPVLGVLAAPDALGAALAALAAALADGLADAAPDAAADDAAPDAAADDAADGAAVLVAEPPPQAIRKALIAEAEKPSTAARTMKSRREMRPSRRSAMI